MACGDFARRVPTGFAHLDRRGVVRHSTKIRIASDRAAVRASRVAEKFNSSLAQHWRALADNDSRDGVDSYNEARRRHHLQQFGEVVIATGADTLTQTNEPVR